MKGAGNGDCRQFLTNKKITNIYKSLDQCIQEAHYSILLPISLKTTFATALATALSTRLVGFVAPRSGIDN